MKCTVQQLSKLIEDYLDNIGECVHKRKWEKKYIPTHAPYNNSDDCYHKWLDWVDDNFERLRELPTFEAIWEELNNKKMKGIGRLTKYDTATLLAFPMDKFPKNVHLNAGAARGAKELGVFEFIVEKQVFVDICPAFQKMSPAQIEDFLCIYYPYLSGDQQGIDRLENMLKKCCHKGRKSRCCCSR